MREYVVTADIARKRDFFGVMVFRDNPEVVKGSDILGEGDRIVHYYDIVAIEKYQGMGYDAMADRVERIMCNSVLANNADLLVDGTGIGDAAVELIRKRGLLQVPIIFSGGTAPVEKHAKMGEVFSGGYGKLAGAKILESISVPKKDLIAAGSVLLQQNRVRIAPGRWTEDFRKQLMGFKGKVNEETRRIKYEAETETLHDDLVVCYLMGAWWVKRRGERTEIPERQLIKDDTADWEPMDTL